MFLRGERMEDTRLPKRSARDVRRIGRGHGLRGGGLENEWMGCFLDDLKAYGINADHQWTTAVGTRGNGAKRRNKGRNVSRQNG